MLTKGCGDQLSRVVAAQQGTDVEFCLWHDVQLRQPIQQLPADR
jgi:hypothetical protein